jgi:hypothetical protein
MTVFQDRGDRCTGVGLTDLRRAAFAGLASFAALLIQPAGAEEIVPILPAEALEKTVVQSAPIDSPKPLDANDPQVETGLLKAMDPAAVGVLDPSEGGFPPDLWSGTPRAVVERLLPGLPVASASPVMRNLARRLLLSRAAVPMGAATVPSLLAQRVERLMAAGRPDQVVRLVGRATAIVDDAAVARARADALILTGDLPAACTAAETMVRDSDDPYWLKAVTLCRAKAGDVAGAALAVELFHEQSAPDPEFSKLSLALIGGAKDQAPVFADLDALRFETLRTLKTPWPTGLADIATPTVLRALASDSALDLDLRLVLAERAADIGALTGAELGRIYSGVAFAPDDVPKALDQAKTTPGPRSNALLYQRAKSASAEEDRLQAMQALWRLAEKAGTGRYIGKVLAEVTHEIEPRDELAWIGADMVRAALAAGEQDQALKWQRILSEDAQTKLWPLLAAANAEAGGEIAAQAVDRWLKTLADLTEPQRRERAILVFVLMEALGVTVDDALWQDAFSDQPISATLPNATVLELLDRTQAREQVGATVIYALMALAPEGPANAHSLVLARVIKAFRAVGLHTDARGIAIEALFGRGL